MPMSPRHKARFELERAERDAERQRELERARRQAANRPPPEPERTCEKLARDQAERFEAAWNGEDVGSPAIHILPTSSQILRDKAEQQAEAERQKAAGRRPEPEPEPAPEPAPRHDARAERDRQLAQAIAKALAAELKGNLNDV